MVRAEGLEPPLFLGVDQVPWPLGEARIVRAVGLEPTVSSVSSLHPSH